MISTNTAAVTSAPLPRAPITHRRYTTTSGTPPQFYDFHEISGSAETQKLLAGENAEIGVGGTTPTTISVASGGIVLIRRIDDAGFLIDVPLAAESFEGEFSDTPRPDLPPSRIHRPTPARSTS